MMKYSGFFCGIGLIVIAFIAGCATYSQTTLDFQKNFVQGEIEEANKVLDKNKKAAKDKNKLLYLLQKGVVLQMLGRYDESNLFFEEAYHFTEDYRQSNLNKAATLLTNPTTKPYTGEDHERVLIHYYKALNYLRMNQYEQALVECRRINNRLNQLNDQYENRNNRYKRDAFAMNLMGIVYEASGNINDAFIAYRNAYEAYSKDYKQHFDTDVPTQLKEDLLRTAYLNGFTDELEHYEKQFSTQYEYQEKEGGELVFFWHNGLGPVKDEWSLNFFIVMGQGGFVVFVNEELGLSFPFPMPAMGEGSGNLSDLKFIRVAFPKYLERKPYNQRAEIVAGGKSFKLELAQNINQIAFNTLEDRMMREFGNSLLRLALKQSAEGQTRKLNQNLGALLSIVNAVSEKADTRNWQTLPFSISYARIPLDEGANTVSLNIYSSQKIRKTEKAFDFHVNDGETIFHSFHSLESIPVSLD